MSDAPRTSNLNLPNLLTLLRIVIVPFFGWALLQDGGDSTTWRWVAFALFAIAMITDKIDGDLARKYDIVTDFGKIADPIADKAITGMALIGLSIVGDVWWWVTILVLVREWGVTALRLSVLSDVVMAASQSGKIKTTLQALALGLLIWPLPHGSAHGGAFDGWGATGEALFLLGQALLAAAVAMTLWSGYEFLRDVRRHRARVASGATQNER